MSRLFSLNSHLKLINSGYQAAHIMSSPSYDHLTANLTTNSATEDPLNSPDFHLRKRSSSSSSRVSTTSPSAACCPDASTPRRQRSIRLFPSCVRAIPFRWLAILLCLITTCLIWRLPPPSTREFGSRITEQLSSSALHVLHPRDSVGPDLTGPEKWLNENSEDALSRNRRWWKRSPRKPRAAIISLVRNEELEGIMQSMRQLEHHWNKKYRYPWVFFNEKPFSDEFKVRCARRHQFLSFHFC